MASSFHLLESHIPIREGNDRMRWKFKTNGDFIVQSFYETLPGSFSMPFPRKAIWRVRAPQRVSFFLWTEAWGKILACENLIKRGYSVVSCMCCCGETADHLLLYLV